MNIQFTKMHGLGNDFMVINGISQTIEFIAEKVQAWAGRHFGFDQLLIVETASDIVVLYVEPMHLPVKAEAITDRCDIEVAEELFDIGAVSMVFEGTIIDG